MDRNFRDSLSILFSLFADFFKKIFTALWFTDDFYNRVVIEYLTQWKPLTCKRCL